MATATSSTAAASVGSADTTAGWTPMAGNSRTGTRGGGCGSGNGNGGGEVRASIRGMSAAASVTTTTPTTPAAAARASTPGRSAGGKATGSARWECVSSIVPGGGGRGGGVKGLRRADWVGQRGVACRDWCFFVNSGVALPSPEGAAPHEQGPPLSSATAVLRKCRGDGGASAW
ncbi:hypothetical protein I4F81_007211 [Pyropia yezoensis]|uniref:Uncharacterized protein n=1 Tax=Pyropia yezoensis TaxID=2788 RepID=A0ACC3C3D0_PYRYE|nr:hypothetical protein I4F81_007211 [Neopyropia yezoensis]